MTSLKALISLVVLALVGCGTNTVFVYSELPMPVQPVLPTVYATEIADLDAAQASEMGLPTVPMVCLSEDAYGKLVMRETLRRNYANELKAVIEAHNAKAE